MGDLEKIRSRKDLSDRLIHITQDLSTLQAIVQSGFIRPTFAPRNMVHADGETRNSIRGPYPAVCFSEMPLAALKELCALDLYKQRYHPYAVSYDRTLLFSQGARPVVYGGEDILDALPDPHKYLWVRLKLEQDSAYYSIDWTHEREWRIRFRPEDREDRFMYDGVPLEFGHRLKPTSIQFIVKSRADSAALQKTIAGLAATQHGACAEPQWYAGYVNRLQADAPKIHVLDDLA
ncbi:hypothetical protein BE21_54505 [Sorangium cellulosum]|uniref:Uncharacterized protein n=1 Tax=Sorangium cellulosum TaxID=56 RepID=A0A150TDG6_SORCE|nr:hypothetical protein BE21_54505 [Sorangium cellulosum]